MKNRLFKNIVGNSEWIDISIEAIQNDYVMSIAINPKDPNILFAGTLKNLVYKSTDNGSSWVKKSNGILPNEYGFSVLKFNPSNAQEIFAASLPREDRYGLYRTTDEGNNWIPSYYGLPINFDIEDMAINPRKPDNIYVAVGGDLVYASFNGGMTWHPSLNGLMDGNIYSGSPKLIPSDRNKINKFHFDQLLNHTPLYNFIVRAFYRLSGDTSSFLVSSIDIDPRHPEILYAVRKRVDFSKFENHSFEEIFCSKDGGYNWHKILDGLGRQSNLKIRLDPKSPDKLYAFDATGLYRYNLMTLSVKNKKYPNIPNKFRLFQNYPNPFNPTTTIRYQLPQAAHVIVAIYDLQGRLVETLVNGEKAAGRYSVQWHAANMPSGVYFYRIQAGRFTAAKKLLLLK